MNIFSWNCFWNAKPDFKSLANEDIDVANERKRINNKDTQDDILVVNNLTKVKDICHIQLTKTFSQFNRIGN